MATARILLVDDDKMICFCLAKVLEKNGFEVTVAGSVTEALKHISIGTFDVLLSDLHMPGAGDGLTVVSAMRHSNPKAVTILLSAYPAMDAAADAIVLQTDEILLKPMDASALVNAIKVRLSTGPGASRVVESVATILERAADGIVVAWLGMVEKDDKLKRIALSPHARSAHLPQLFRDLVRRLRSYKELGSKELQSAAAAAHGVDRRKQGYSAAMIVEGSRILQVSIFRALQQNLTTIDFSILLLGVMTIADEVDSQLSQTMHAYVEEPVAIGVPA